MAPHFAPRSMQVLRRSLLASAMRSPRAMTMLKLRCLTARQELAHAVQRLQNVLGRVGVGQAHVAFAEDAEVRAADGDDAGVVEQRAGELLGFPAGALDVGERIERALRRGA